MPSYIHVEIQGSRQLRDKITGRFSTVVDAEAIAIIKDVADYAKDVAKSGAPVDLGALKRDIFAVPRGLAVEVVSSRDYSATQEFGRRAGATPPPWRSLIGWTGRHFATTNVKRTAYIVAQSIGRKGFRGKFYMTKAGHAAEKYAQLRLAKAKVKIESEWNT